MNERMKKEVEELEGRAQMLRLRVRELEQAARQLIETEAFLSGYKAAAEASEEIPAEVKPPEEV